MFGSYLWFCRVLFVARGPWVQRAPGLPCALFFFSRANLAIARTQCAARTETHGLHTHAITNAVIASAAKQSMVPLALDCFAALAMTIKSIPPAKRRKITARRVGLHSVG